MRALFDDGGNRVDLATPSIPVQVCQLKIVFSVFQIYCDICIFKSVLGLIVLSINVFKMFGFAEKGTLSRNCLVK